VWAWNRFKGSTRSILSSGMVTVGPRRRPVHPRLCADVDKRHTDDRKFARKNIVTASIAQMDTYRLKWLSLEQADRGFRDPWTTPRLC